MREVTRPMRGEVVVRAECLLPEKLLERALCEGARFDALRRDGENCFSAVIDHPRAVNAAEKDLSFGGLSEEITICLLRL